MKQMDEMTDDELIAAISELQAVRVPSSKTPKQPKRLDEKKPPKAATMVRGTLSAGRRLRGK